jgi:hypothetical protein
MSSYVPPLSSVQRFIINEEPSIKNIPSKKVIQKNTKTRCQAVDTNHNKVCRSALNFMDKTFTCLGCGKSFFCAKHRQAEFHNCPEIEKVNARATELLAKEKAPKKRVSQQSYDGNNAAC